MAYEDVGLETNNEEFRDVAYEDAGVQGDVAYAEMWGVDMLIDPQKLKVWGLRT